MMKPDIILQTVGRNVRIIERTAIESARRIIVQYFNGEDWNDMFERFECARAAENYVHQNMKGVL